MSRLINSGAEMQTTTDGVEFPNFYGTAANLTIETTIKRSGSAAWKFVSTASDSVEFEWAYTAVGTYARAFIRFSAFPTDSVAAIMESLGAVACIAITTEGKLRLYDGNITGTQRGSDSSALSLNTWYCVELKIINGAATELEARYCVDGGTPSVFASGALTTASNPTGFAFGFIDWCANSTMYMDDLIVNSDAGTANNSWVGATEKLVLALPTGAGDFAADTGLYSYINEIPPTNTATTGSTMIELDTTTSKADYVVTSPSTLGIGSSDTITMVQVLARVREESNGTSNYTLRIKSASSGTVTASSSVDGGNTTPRTNPSGTTAWGSPLISQTDPTTTLAWTVTGTNSLTNMQIGAATTDGSPDIWVLWLGAYIGYIPATTAIKTINALAKASVKTINGLAIASVKTWDGLA